MTSLPIPVYIFNQPGHRAALGDLGEIWQDLGRIWGGSGRISGGSGGSVYPKMIT